MPRIFATSALLTAMAVGSAIAQTATKPAESTSRVKKVLLYNKVGGWVHTDGIADVKTVMGRMATAKRFALTQLEDDGSITLDFLKQFQVIVWNNNVNGSGSVPSTTARTAIINYVKGGGGWLLIHGAGDHGDTWADLKSAMGTKFTEHGNQGNADAVKDPDGAKHPEMKFMIQDLPATIRLKDEWYGFQNTVRPLAGVTVLYTAKNGENNVLRQPADGLGDYTYIWGREYEKGRLVYDAIGHGQNQLMAQADSIVPKMYWEAMRYLAGDFKNGCTDPTASNYDSTARVNVGCTAVGIQHMSGPMKSNFALTKDGQRFQLDFVHQGDFHLTLRDIQGAVVWAKNVSGSADEARLDKSVLPGVYYMEARASKAISQQRIVIR